MMKARAVARRIEKGYLIRALIADLIFILVIAAFIVVVLLVLSNVYGNPHIINDHGGEGYVTRKIFSGIMPDQTGIDNSGRGIARCVRACNS